MDDEEIAIDPTKWKETSVDWGWGDGEIVLHEVPCVKCQHTIPVIKSSDWISCENCGLVYRIEYTVYTNIT